MASSLMLEDIKRATRVEDLLAELAGTDVRDLTGREVSVIGRKIEKLRERADLRIAYLGSHTLEPLPQYVSVAAAERGIQLAGHVGEFNQYYQEVLGAVGDLKAFDPQIMVLFLSLRELSPSVSNAFAKLDEKARQAEFDTIVQHVTEWADLAVQGSNASLLIANFVTPPARQAGIADLQDPQG
ncbi:MAG: hypothetical protein AAF637_10175, partial [Pseudomonadota bacterium]